MVRRDFWPNLQGREEAAGGEMPTGNRVLPGALLPAARGLAAGRPVTAERAIRAERNTAATRLPTSAAASRTAGERALSRPLPVITLASSVRRIPRKPFPPIPE